VTINTALESFLLNGFQWTTEPPTQEGWYWGFHKNKTVYMFWVGLDDDNILMAYFNGYPVPFESHTHWLGPLPVPEPPNEAER